MAGTVCRLALLFVLPLLVGCASGYEQFYRPSQGLDPALVAARRPAPPPANPIIERGRPADPKVIVAAYMRRGYVVIGNSSFNSGNAEPEENAVEQARKVGADLVLILNPRYTGSVTSAVPIVTPTTTTSYSSGTATAFGSGGPVTAYGTGTTTTYGTQTTYVPMTSHRSDYGAVYFVKQRFGLGISVRNLNDAERQELQSNKGAAVDVVVDGSPAFEADILAGDIITSLDGVPVVDAPSFLAALRERAGHRVSLTLSRRGKAIEKSVLLATN